MSSPAAPSPTPNEDAARSVGTLFDLIEKTFLKIVDEGLDTVLQLPKAVEEVITLLLKFPDGLGSSLGDTVVAILAVLAGYGLAAWLLASRRARASQRAIPFLGLLQQAGYDLLALCFSIVCARVILVRGFGIQPGSEVFAAKAVVSIIRWLFFVAIIRFFFQPSAPRLRGNSIDDQGASTAMFWAAWLSVIGYVHSLLLEAAVRSGLTASSAKALSILVAVLMMAGALRLIMRLRAHGLKPVAAALGCAAISLVGALAIAGVLSGDTNLFRGATASIAILALGWTLDRVLARSIRDSRRPSMMRRLFLVRVVVDAIAAALIIRILFEFWFAGYSTLFGVPDWAAFSRRLTLASIILVFGLWICALVHVWTQARLAPSEGDRLPLETVALRSRLATILPIVRFGAIAIILLVTALTALSIIGVDITPLMAAAGILGLAISLGSQTLVKDIVSGLFYMFDDVFRLGETIETNARRGLLEHISTRSVRLRDENGSVHTIPFGDLGTVTNLSRRLVRLAAQVTFVLPVDEAVLAAQSRALVMAITSEDALQNGIVGTIAATVLASSRSEDDNRIDLSFLLGAVAAQQAEALTRHLLESEMRDAGFAASTYRIAISIEEPGVDKPDRPMPSIQRPDP